MTADPTKEAANRAIGDWIDAAREHGDDSPEAELGLIVAEDRVIDHLATGE